MSVFSNSTHLADWQHTNCHQCQKYGETIEDCTCPLAQKLDLAMVGDPEPPTDFFEPYGFEREKIPEQCHQIKRISEETEQ